MTDNQRIDQHLFQKFKIIKKLGSGAYGHVWKVESLGQKNERMALKKVFQAFQHETDAQRTFRQISILKKIEHPNIIKLFQVIPSLSGRDIYLVFEYMNTDLYHVIYEGILQEIHKKYIAYQLLLGIYYLHSASLIHRDLKPSNILLNQNCNLKICDFGLVRYIGRDRQQDTVLTEGVATRWYRAPQILIGSSKYNQKADMWSIGCIIAQMYLKSPLFNCNSTIKQLQKIIQVIGFPKPEEIKDVSNELGNILFKQFNNIKQKPLKETFGANMNDQSLDLIIKLLKFNKSQRFSAEEALKHPYFKGFYKQSDLKRYEKDLIIQTDDNVKLHIQDYKRLILTNFVQKKQKSPERRTLTKFLQQTKQEPARFSDLKRNQKSFGKFIQEIQQKRESVEKNEKQHERKNVHLFQQLLRDKGSSGQKDSRISSKSRLKQNKQNEINNDNTLPFEKNLQKFINTKNAKPAGTFAALRKTNNTKFYK